MKLPDEPAADAQARGLAALLRAESADAFAWLGPHALGSGWVLRALLPGALQVQAIAVADGSLLSTLERVHADGLFVGHLSSVPAYRLRIEWPGGTQETADPYAFGALLGDLDLHLLAEGRHLDLAGCLGAHPVTVAGVPGVRFAVWAPNAWRVAVVGDFNAWDRRRLPMRLRHDAGVWELFVPGLMEGAAYKYEVLGADGLRTLRADPVAWHSELPPGTASLIRSTHPHTWTDAPWMAERAMRHTPDQPVSIYEVHAGSWQRNDWGTGAAPDWDELAQRLVPYVVDLGFTHVELLPVMEHPFGGSWGYQPLALFAPTARHGSPAAFARFVDACHAAGLGVILDWVPAHFPGDAHGLRHFDGTALYEHADPREGWHPDWQTAIYNLGRREVAGFLIASALHWAEHYHVDGLRVDAVASMLYRDYSRNPGEWVPNAWGGRENVEAIEFLRRLNDTLAQRCPGMLVIAEESTAWPGVTQATSEGGLGFAYKWNMGWMHDTLRYFGRDPVHRRHHHHDITFSAVYAHSERFVLPLSHDEVVHGKGSLLSRMAGDHWQRHANLRACLAMQWHWPGKKLLFMGGEMAQEGEWQHDAQLPWASLENPLKQGVQRLTGDLNRVYRSMPALHAGDCSPQGFAWVVGDDFEQSVFAWLRWDPARGLSALVVCNLTPVPRHGYRLGVPQAGAWRVVLNTDSGVYGGSNFGPAWAQASTPGSHGQSASLSLDLPPLAVLVLAPD